MTKVAIILANGFEEIEAMAPIDLLRRAGVTVDTVSINENNHVISSRKITVLTDKIINEINRLKKEKYSQAFLSEEDIFQKYVDIAFSDISDYVNFGTEDIVIGVDDNGNDIVATKSYVRFKEVSEVDGSLINEIKIGKDGASIKLTDKMNALKWLADHMGFATEQQKLSMRETISKIENNKEMLDIAKEKLELEKMKVQTSESAEDKLDLLIESVKEVVSDE